MLEKKIKIRESVDVYILEEGEKASESVKIQFYKINTRERVTIVINRIFLRIIKELDGNRKLSKIVSEIGCLLDESELTDIFEYLDKKSITKFEVGSSYLDKESLDRYSRQINYLDNYTNSSSGEFSQARLMKKKIVIIGVGATGATIATSIVRAGVTKIKIIDPKTLKKEHVSRHIYAGKDNIGELKVAALSKYLKKINSTCDIEISTEKLKPNSDLNDLIPGDTNIVVNTADEPYIGHTTIKLGRYLWDKDIGLYVSGGFDAHLMSSGELIARGLTPCADCCSVTFQKALSNWKPKYNIPSKEVTELVEPSSEVIIGSEQRPINLMAGGIFSQSLYSSSVAVMNIVDYLLDNSESNGKLNSRGEYLINSGKNSWFKMEKQPGCRYCGS